MLEALRLRRGELRESMGALERAMAAPAEAGRSRWGQRVHLALVELSGDVREHIEIISVLLRHRQRGSDLVFEAYEVDIGGET
ncbi:MAG TPA: hypothetical protein VFJ22_12850 [Dermatophilaceae bacterium]|jgi:hypothetical protein|nr:hypothetical protein [Dermatophilaceae bacterium]